ncbi:MAG: pteridine reductase [Lysobacterales bacterium CG17_big_fil_post_rev_8_21_14_2_50_64_11]|nr:MAG: pteridine reductase [Xanthomonadales bacterium CG17_big_fil_post_rev_8_21_14_2_50_64_11]PIX61437.1 MAG: pteridine reductase [Xanthomonadales bacterium CG_4_10_14_3_um_filter_64_11]
MSEPHPVILITGAARRVGAAIARHLHAHGCRLVLHYRNSGSEAQALAAELNRERADSALLVQADLAETAKLGALIERAVAHFGRLDGLVNNASAFYATPIESATQQQWDELMNANAKAPFFLAKAAAPHLRASGGAIVNVIDIYAQRPLPRHPLYSTSKAALSMVTLALAQALGPEIRVNAVAPGTVLWADNPQRAETVQQVESGTALRRVGSAHDVAVAVRFLLLDARYSTGTILRVDGGRLLAL